MIEQAFAVKCSIAGSSIWHHVQVNRATRAGPSATVVVKHPCFSPIIVLSQEATMGELAPADSNWQQAQYRQGRGLKPVLFRRREGG